MTPDWLSATADVVAAGAAVVGLAFIGFQLRQARKEHEAETLRRLLDDIQRTAATMRDVMKEPDLHQKRVAFDPVVNHLEFYATSANRKLSGRIARKFIQDYLEDTLAMIIQGGHQDLLGSLTSGELQELNLFLKSNRKSIDRRIEALYLTQ